MTLTLSHPKTDLPPVKLRVLPPAHGPAGSVLTSFEPGRAIVWLRGEIDLALADDLAELVSHVHDLGPHLVIEVSQLTFCDVTLVNFLAAVSKEVAVTVRRPPRLLTDLLKMCNLIGRVQIADFPGPAPRLPA